MWVVKETFKESKGVLGALAKECNVSLKAYILSSNTKDKELYAYLSVEIDGSLEDKEKFCKKIKKHPDVIKTECKNESFGIIKIKRDPILDYFYNAEIIHLKPMLVSNKGVVTCNIGSFNRQALKKFIKVAEQRGGELCHIKREKIKHISIISLYPNLTSKQKKAFETALNEGYYQIPKKISIQELADKTNVSFSTFRMHLKKAEAKLLEFTFSQI